jgi:hypothetical protein
MKTLRWIAALPVAMALSLAAWFALSAVLTGAHGGLDFVTRVVGYAPIVIRTFFPTVLFVVSAVLVCPSKGRKPPFVFFALAILLSGGGAESLSYYQIGMLTFWVTSFAGVFAGALAGLFVSLWLQNYGQNRPNKTSAPTATNPPPSATSPAPLAHL